MREQLGAEHDVEGIVFERQGLQDIAYLERQILRRGASGGCICGSLGHDFGTVVYAGDAPVGNEISEAGGYGAGPAADV